MIFRTPLALLFAALTLNVTFADSSPKKLLWLIPDGMRADPYLFDIFAWAQEGKLPNIKKMMDHGTYGYSIPVFPSHTPVNFATLLTGAYPTVHGVTDGPMHTEGSPLEQPSLSGFSSTAKKVPPIWKTLEEAGKKVALLSIPGSTPPELNRGYTFRGRWGGWGADFYPIICQSEEVPAQGKAQRKDARMSFLGPALTQYVGVHSNPADPVACPSWGLKIFLSLHPGHDSADRVSISVDNMDKKTALVSLAAGEWSEWFPVTLKWAGIPVDTKIKFKAIKLGPNGFFRIRVLYGGLNEFITKPADAAKELTDAAGPMVDFVDNYPAQLIHYPEDKQTFLEESDMSFQWHQAAGNFIMDHYKPDIFIHDIYSPNQMLTSRWWLGYIDPASRRYKDVTEPSRKLLWNEVMAMYRHLDDLIGEMLKRADENTIVALSSDHGAVPLDRTVRLNNLFAREGLLQFTIDSTGEARMDWKKTKAVFLSAQNIYINPDGLEGPWNRSHGEKYEKLRQRVKDLILDLHDINGERPANHVLKWEEASEFVDLPADRSGDLILSSNPGFGWVEDMTPDHELFTTPEISGYKQTMVAATTPGLWTPFIVMGPGVKKSHRLKDPIHHVDQYPTLMTLLGMRIPSFVQGKVIEDSLIRTNR